MNNTLLKNLIKQFESHRVVFWYDASSEFSTDLDDMPEGVTLLRASEYNDFALKYEILKKRPDKQLLVYFEKDEPQYEDNWLLDVQIENTVFRTDADSIMLADLNLPHSFIDIIRNHSSFFKDSKNRKKLDGKISQGISRVAFEELLIAITLGEDSFNIQNIVDALVLDKEVGKAKKYELLKKYNLTDTLWKKIATVYGYNTKEPSVKDFCLSVFESSLKRFLNTDSSLSSDAIALLKHWKDSFSFKSNGVFKNLSEYASEQLSAQKNLSSLDLSYLLDFDDYRFIEEEIITRLIEAVKHQTMTAEAIRQILERRRSSYWFDEYEDIYQAVVIGKTLLDEIKLLSLNASSAEEYVSRYYRDWYKIDNHYRKYMYYVMEKSPVANNLLSSITLDIESRYINGYLIPLNEKWTPYASEMLKSNWRCKDSFIIGQGLFYGYNLQSIVQKGNKVIVVISDALRYEIGDELVSEINSQQRYTASIKPMLSSVPSYTQLGMAALLPHKELEMGADAAVYIENHTSTNGLLNRDKILKNAIGEKAIALDATDVLKTTAINLRDIIAANNVIYIYHDIIDKNGEDNLLKAANDAIEELKKLIKLLGSANANNIWLTADHGFIYQVSDLETHQYLAEGSVKGKSVKHGRRFSIGYDLEDNPALMITKLSDIGLSDTDGLEVAFPSSILRMRLQGANTNFVHGGLALQEVIIPLIKIEKARKDDVTDVGVRLLTNLKTITTGSVVLTFYQEDYVSDKVHGFDATFGIYSSDGKSLSDIEKRSITSESLDSKAREFQIVLHLNKESEKYNRKEVYVKIHKILSSGRLEEKISKPVMLSRSIASDFDF